LIIIVRRRRIEILDRLRERAERGHRSRRAQRHPKQRRSHHRRKNLAARSNAQRRVSCIAEAAESGNAVRHGHRAQALQGRLARRHAALAGQSRRAPADTISDAAAARVGGDLLALSDPILDLLDAIDANLLTRGLAILARDLALLDTFDAVRTRLLASDLTLLDALDARRARLLALRPHLDTLRTLRSCLLTFSAHLRALRALRTLRALGQRRAQGLARGTRRSGPRGAALSLRGLSILATIVATRTRRSRH
jgi:hypothetical protein